MSSVSINVSGVLQAVFDPAPQCRQNTGPVLRPDGLIPWLPFCCKSRLQLTENVQYFARTVLGDGAVGVRFPLKKKKTVEFCTFEDSIYAFRKAHLSLHPSLTEFFFRCHSNSSNVRLAMGLHVLPLSFLAVSVTGPVARTIVLPGCLSNGPSCTDFCPSWLSQ